MVYNVRGEAVRADEPHGWNHTPEGAPRAGWRRLRLSDALSTADPASRLSSAVTDGGEGAGIVFPLNGSWGSNDWSGNYPNVVWSLDDLFGRVMAGSMALSVTLVTRLRGTFAATDEFAIGVALVNEAVLTGSTVDGKGIHMVGTGAGGAGVLSTGNCNSNNGTGTLSNGAMTAGTVGSTGTVVNLGGATPRCGTTGSVSIDSSGNVVAGAGTAATGALSLTAVPARWYLAGFAGRLSAGVAGGLSPAADFFYMLAVHTPLNVL